VLEWLEEAEDGWPKLWLLEGAAPNLQRTLPRLTADPDNLEDVADGQEDHAPDSLRYGLGPPSAAPWTRRGLEIVTTMGEAPRYELPSEATRPSSSPATAPSPGAAGQGVTTTMADTRTIYVVKRAPDGTLRRVPTPMPEAHGPSVWVDPAGERLDGSRISDWGDQEGRGFG
jgi:hypothetical protein